MQRLQRFSRQFTPLRFADDRHLDSHCHDAALTASPVSATASYAAAKPILAGLAELAQHSGTRRLSGKSVLITGASRGIGLEIAKECSRHGAKVAILAKSSEPQPRLPGTIFTAAEECRKLGAEAVLPIKCDIRNWEEIQGAVEQVAKEFGGIDVCINNASAISLTCTAETSHKKLDLMWQVNTRGTFLVSKACLPHLLRVQNPHILNISPPLDLSEHWFAPHTGYSISKYGMSLCVLGMAGEFRDSGVAVNALWPKTSIATSAVQNVIGGDQMMRYSRAPGIMALAAIAILTCPARKVTGNFFIDEQVLRMIGITDLNAFAAVPGTPEEDILPDFFV